MTNREWIQTLTNEELAKWMVEEKSTPTGWKEIKLPTGETMQMQTFDNLYPRLREITWQYSNSLAGLQAWLGQERQKETKNGNETDNT